MLNDSEGVLKMNYEVPADIQTIQTKSQMTRLFNDMTKSYDELALLYAPLWF